MFISEEMNEIIGIFADGMQFSALMVLLLLFTTNKERSAVYFKVYGVILGYLFLAAGVKFAFTIFDLNYNDWNPVYILTSLMLIPLIEGLFNSMYRQNQSTKNVFKRVLKGAAFLIFIGFLSLFMNFEPWLQRIAYVYASLYAAWTFFNTLLKTRKFNNQVSSVYSNAQNKNLKWVRRVLWAAVITVCLFVLSKFFVTIWTRIIFDVISIFLYTAIGIFLIYQKPVDTEMVDKSRMTIDGDMIDSIKIRLNNNDNHGGLNSRVLLNVAEKVNRLMVQTTIFLKSDVTLEEMAEAIEVNPVHLSYYINTEMGVRFEDYVNSFRLDYAAELVRSHEEMKTEEIAVMSGFSDVKTLKTLYQDRFGYSIRQYREKGDPKDEARAREFFGQCEKEYPEYEKKLLAYEPTLSECEITLSMLVVLGYSFNKVVDSLNIGPASLDVRYSRLRSKLRLLRTDQLKATLESILG